ncbi:beta strand repeat-containing protein [Pseudahrensia aquimaris]|uniref:Beta strand repeat-containing protein n=1 Tax=Pseudahrensia aquimaris TaxID=744461 RepID=A0ABW3FDK4_9HYPH
MAQVTVNNGFNATLFDHSISLQLIQTATTFSYSSLTGDIVTLNGTFSYPGGLGTNPIGTLDSVTIDIGNDGTTDLSTDYSTPPTDFSGLFSPQPVFFDSLFQQDDVHDLTGSFVLFSLSGFYSNGGVFGAPSQTVSDTASISGSGAIFGDAIIGGGSNAPTGDDLITVTGLTGDLLVVGDTRYKDASPDTSVYGEDNIADTSSSSSFNLKLIGDFDFTLGNLDGGTINAGIDTITGGLTAVTIIGDGRTLDGRNNSVFAAADILTGSSKADTIIGDIDTLLVDPLGANILHAGGDTIDGGAGDDIIYGDYRVLDPASVVNQGSDTINDGAGNDLIYGQVGDDVLFGGTGSDTIDGGTGRDTANFSLSANAVTVILGMLGADGSAIGNGTDILREIEDVTGSALGDMITGNEAANGLVGGGGDDTLIGGGGNDDYWIDSSDDVILELAGEGYDEVFTDLASYTLGANVERLNFIDGGNHSAKGNALNNRFAGNAGQDTFILDEGGADIFSGGQGQDVFDARLSTNGINIDLATGMHGGDAAGDRFSSIEVFWGSNNAGVGDTMITELARAKFYGFRGDDDLTGGATVDYLDGGVGNDVLNGMGARDGLRGFTGDDTLTGGSDRDYFQYVVAGFDHDTITDFQDGLDYLRIFSNVADEISDFTIAGNGTSSVLLTLNDGTGENTITLNSDDGSNIIIDSGDFLFY